MKRILLLAAALLMVATSSFATYMIVLKDGTRYRAKQKWTINGKLAVARLESGELIQFDSSLIDHEATDEANRLGYGDAMVISTGTTTSSAPKKAAAKPLGSVTSLRKLPAGTSRDATADTPGKSDANEPAGPPLIGKQSVRMFSKAYDNVGIYDAEIEPLAGYRLRVQLTADNEDTVFKAISATCYVMTHIPDQRIDMVELFMATLNGGSSGRFQITPDEAKKINDKKISWQDYYVAKVIF